MLAFDFEIEVLSKYEAHDSVVAHILGFPKLASKLLLYGRKSSDIQGTRKLLA